MFDWEPDFFKKKLRDLLQVGMIVVTEALVAILIFAVTSGLGWCIKYLSPDQPRVSEMARDIADIGSLLYFVIFVVKDILEYVRK